MRAIRGAGAAGGTMRGPRGGVYHMVNGKRVSGPAPTGKGALKVNAASLQTMADKLRAVKHANPSAAAHYAKIRQHQKDGKGDAHVLLAQGHAILSGKQQPPPPVQTIATKSAQVPAVSPTREAAPKPSRVDIREALARFAAPHRLAEVKAAIAREDAVRKRAEALGVGVGGVARKR